MFEDDAAHKKLNFLFYEFPVHMYRVHGIGYRAALILLITHAVVHALSL